MPLSSRPPQKNGAHDLETESGANHRTRASDSDHIRRRRRAFRPDRVVPGASRRDEFGLGRGAGCALLVVDIQRYLCPGSASAAGAACPRRRQRDDEEGLTAGTLGNPERAVEDLAEEAPSSPSSLPYCSAYYQERFPGALSNIATLVETFRSIRDGDGDGPGSCSDDDDPDPGASPEAAAAAAAASNTNSPPPVRAPPPAAARCEVIFTYLQALTNDGRDVSLDYKLSGPLLANIPRAPSGAGGERAPSEEVDDALFLGECRPSPAGRGDIRLPKTSCNVFASTNLDYLLRQLGVRCLVLVGQMTEQCVESAVRHAADLGYFCLVVSDACLAASQEAHESSLRRMSGYARVVDTASELVRELRDPAGREPEAAGDDATSR